MTPATEFLKNLKPAKPLGKPTGYRLDDRLETFLKEVADARGSNKSAVLREIVSGAKAQWEQLTPAQRKGAEDE